MRLIDADQLRETLRNRTIQMGGFSFPLPHLWESAILAVDAQPTIDAEPVVRCEECKHRGTGACPMCFDFDEYDENCGYEYRVIDRTEDDGHCHKGEKEGNHAAD